MNKAKWIDEHYDNLFDDWCDSDIESLEEFTEIKWNEYQEHLAEMQIYEYGNRQEW